MLNSERYTKHYEKLCRYGTFFITCSILGWVYETVLEVFIYKTGFSNRGYLHGPYCIVYGFGGIILLVCLNKLVYSNRSQLSKIAISFPSIMIITTTVELIASYIMEYTTGSWMWNYKRFIPNFQGRIALNPSLRFGVGGIVLLYMILPMIDKLDYKKQKYITIILLPVIIIDMILTSTGI